MKWSPEQWALLAITTTVCVSLLLVSSRALFNPLSDEQAGLMKEVLLVMIGIIAGRISSRDNSRL